MSLMRATVLWLLTAIGPCAWGQGDSAPQATTVEVERARIDALRVKKLAEFESEDAACLSKFAVAGCQSAVGARRRHMLADLKRREIRLNDAQREKRGEEQLQRERDKAVDNAQRQRDLEESRDRTSESQRRQALDEKVRDHQNQARPAATKASGAKTTSVLDAATVEKNRAAYLDKQTAVDKRRKDRDQQLLDHGSGGPPLPVAPP